MYVETSAAAKLLVEEAESDALSRYLDDLAENEVGLVSSTLMETELRRFAVRHELSQAAVSDLLDRFDLLEPDRAIFVEAGLLPGTHLRSLDALHIAVAVRVAAESMIAYDSRQTAAAREVGLRVVAPA
ncbi:MAG: type II toxin-antitoxin system VapC family toxin [Haloechinothrix sp.]